VFAFSRATVVELFRGAGVIESGQLIAGHYRLVEHIGSGAMGVVWRAIDERLERSVAVKQILAQPGLSEAERDNMRQRAMREAKNAARFQHPNAIVVFDIAEHGGDPCLVMEYLEGRSLSALLAEQTTLPLAQVARIGEQVASALVAAHRAGIVHRDVKPGNILLDNQGTTKITDFGISRAAGDMALTQTGLIGGTPAYLAPELARGSDPVPSSDVFALGATLYQALEGTTPYGDTSNQLALLYAAANGQIQPPRQAGAATALLMSLLRNEPGDRPTMAEARDRLAALARNEPTPPGIQVSPPLFNSGNAGRRPAGVTDTPARGIPGAERPPWQRVEPTVQKNTSVAAPTPPRPTPPPTAAYMPTQARPPARQAAAPLPPSPPQRPAPRRPVGNPDQGQNPDTKRRAILLASAAAVIVIAVIVFVALNSGGNTDQPSAGATTPKPSTSAGASSKAPAASAATPANLGTAPSEIITDYSGAGNFLVAFFGGVGSASTWNMLTPAAQAVYGSEQAFADYWSQHKITGSRSAKADSGGGEADGSIIMNYTLNNGPRSAFRMIKTGGQYLIDADTKVLGQ
jgi:serine/threonine protein kinase